MIIKKAQLIDNDNRIINCRIQSLCDLLAMKGINATPKLLYLSCIKTLYNFTEITCNRVNYPFVSSFDEDIEIQFFNDFNLSYRMSTSEISLQSFKNNLKNEEPFLILCDANSVLKNRKNKGNFQIGVCSGITIVGYNKFRKILFSQLNQKKDFTNISFDLLSYSRNFDILPSSPVNISIHINDEYSRNQECNKKLNDYDILYNNLKMSLKTSISNETEELHKYTNKGLEFFKNKKAKEKLINFLNLLQETLHSSDIDPDIIDKIFSLKLRMLRKSMISGTTSFNRLEISDSIFELWQLNPNDKLKDLYSGFTNSATNFRNITRKLYSSNNLKDKKETFLIELKDLLQIAFDYEYQLIINFLS